MGEVTRGHGDRGHGELGSRPNGSREDEGGKEVYARDAKKSKEMKYRAKEGMRRVREKIKGKKKKNNE